MNNTPRLRSAYPSTPRGKQNDGQSATGAAGQGLNSSGASTALNQTTDDNAPLIPLTLLDAPSQRFYVFTFYACLTAWRLYDYSKLISDQSDSLWLWMKWASIDGVSMYGIQGLKIPWLQWSATTVAVFFLVHAILNAVVLFRIPIPFGMWLTAVAKTVYDRELAVSERSVKPGSVLHNSSLILGKQIIHILPEGSAILNPDQGAFCLDSARSAVELPIRINQTQPILIELLRIDLDTNVNETITISGKDVKKLKRQADKEVGKRDTTGPRVLKVPVRQIGLYRLLKVVDESNLEVQRRISDTLVVRCPSASIKTVSQNKCTGELSDFIIQVDATPPLKIKYSKIINREDSSHVYLNIHPENFETPLSGQSASGALVKVSSGQSVDVSWARTQHIEIPINETMGTSGGWKYSIDEIHDACGNVANYTHSEEFNMLKARKSTQLEQVFLVHRPPKATFGCSSEMPLKVARRKSVNLPISIRSLGDHKADSSDYHVSYTFTPDPSASEQEDDALIRVADFSMKASDKGPEINQPGLYMLKSVSTDFCTGEILEPSSCLLLNPPEPDLAIASESIPDKCAGNAIGLLVDLDLIGTPPFYISYIVHRDGGGIEAKGTKISHMRTQLELKPAEAGHYTYEFVNIQDAVYPARSLKHKNLKLEQDVRPPASARFLQPVSKRFACIEEPVSFDVRLSGEPPWALEYEMLHRGKRKKYRKSAIEKATYMLLTERLTEGGEYLLSLTSVTDNSGCKTLLEEDAKIEVRHQRPEVVFGNLQGKRNVMALEGKKVTLPVRLTGNPPWSVSYRKLDDSDADQKKVQMKYANDVLEVNGPGVYEIQGVSDKTCPGSVDLNANRFEVSWIARPSIQVVSGSSMNSLGGILSKNPICEGDQDALELSLTGNPPYSITYEIHMKPEHGSASLIRRQETAGLNAASVQMESIQAGHYEYKFTGIGDQRYEHDYRKFTPMVVHQMVRSRPSASFANKGKTYSYCKHAEQAGHEVIPISLVGTPPFSLEIGIRHHATAKPEIVSIPNIETHIYNFHIPHRVLGLGTHGVTIRKLQDVYGCQRITEFDGPAVQVDVVDVPNISPLESTTEYCIGDRISYALSGTPPFIVFYVFNGIERKASEPSTTFRRIAEKPGNFTITGISDKVSTDSCRARHSITKMIHELPSVRISKGRTAEVDIHEGGEAQLLFEFGGTPPFEFTYTRSTNAAKGRKSIILETKTEVSEEYSKSTMVSEEGTYEVVAIRDHYCGFSTQRAQGKTGQQLLTFR